MVNIVFDNHITYDSLAADYQGRATYWLDIAAHR